MGTTPRNPSPDTTELLTRAVAVLASADLDAFLTRFASRYSAAEAVAVAKAIGANPQGWLDQRANRQSAVRQNSHHVGAQFDPAHDQRVLDAIYRGASNAELNQIMAEVAAEYAASPVRQTGPPGVYRDEIQPPTHRSQPLTADRSQS